MPTRTDYPYEIRVIEHALIPLSDGTKLSAMIWLPVDAEQNPVPAILEYLRYRKRDGTAERDALNHRLPNAISRTATVPLACPAALRNLGVD